MELPPLVTSPSGPLRILHFSPQGSEQTPTTVTIVFDRPVRTLAKDDPGPAGFAIEPPVPGRWTWVGTHAVVFEPTAHQFPKSTAYRVRIPEQLHGIDGARLQGPAVFSFETSRPKVSIGACPYESLKPMDSLTISFSQEFTDAELRRVVHVQARPVSEADSARAQDTSDDSEDSPARPALSADKEGFQPWPIRVQRLRHEPSTSIAILPEKPWPIASQVRVLVESSLTSMEGPLPAVRAFERRCRTVQPPRASLNCADRDEQCSSYGVEFYFDNSPLCKDLSGRVRVEPFAPTFCDAQTSLAIGPLKPSSHYRVMLPKGLHGKHGGITLTPQVIEFDTRAPEPDVEHNIVGEGQVEPHLLQPLHVTASDTPTYRLAVRALTPREYIRIKTGAIEDDETEFDVKQRLLQGSWQVHQNVPPYHQDVPLKGWLDADTGTGALLVDVDVQSEGIPFHDHSAALMVSDLALTTKLWLDGARVWVTSLKTQEPISQAQVTLMTKERSVPLGVTGADGSLTLPPSALEGYWVPRPYFERDRLDANDGWSVLVQKGKDWNAQRLSAAWPQQWAPPIPGSRLPMMFLLLDRGVYRPGESVYVKGYVQQTQQGSRRPLSERAVTVQLRDSAKSLATSNVATNAFGAFNAQFTVPQQVNEPHLRVWARTDEDSAGIDVPISEFRPVEFEVQAHGPEAVTAGEKAAFEIKGNYLHGDPMSGALVDYSTSYVEKEFLPPNTEGYQTSASELARYSDFAGKDSPQASGKTLHLGVDGSVQIETESPRDLLTSRRLTLKSTVYDAARRGIETQAATWVHPADYYVGLRDLNPPLVGQSLQVESIAVRHDGTRIPGRKMEITLLRIETLTEKAANESEDERGPTAPGRLKTVTKCNAISSATSSRCSLMPRQSGKHVLHAVSIDDHGRRAHAAIPIFVGPNQLVGVSIPWLDREEPERLSPVLQLDQQDYHWRDQARLSISSPFKQAWALVTLERDGVYWSDARMIGSSAQFEVPVLAAIGNNAQIDVLLLRYPGRPSLYTSAKYFQARAHGSIALHVAKDQHRLNVVVTPSVVQAGPGEKFDCDFQVTDRHHQPMAAELTVWAVDDGVLKLTAYGLPNPETEFSRESRLETSTLDSHLDLAWFRKPEPPKPPGPYRGGIALGSVGAAGAGPHGPGQHEAGIPRHRGPSTILFEPHLITDDQGRARLTIRLPGQLSRFRVMAVAASKSAEYGAAEATVAARLPLRTRSMMPRFVRVGDEFEAGVVVAADASVNTSATIRAQATGLLPLTGVARTVSLADGRATDVLFRWRAKEPGTANFRIDVATATDHDAVAFEVPVRRSHQKGALALYGETRSARAERVAPLPGAVANSAKLDFALANTPLVGLSQAIGELADYPHTCSEQLASRLLLFGALRDFARNNGVRVPADYEKQAEAIIKELRKRQSYDGGFRYWDNDRDPDVWLSAYVTWVLARTARSGVEVEKRELQSAADYVLQAPHRSGKERRKVSDPTLAFIADVAAEISATQSAAVLLEALAAKHDELPLFARAWLLHALRTAHSPNPKWAPLAKQLEQSLLGSLVLSGDRAFIRAETKDYGALLDSSERTLALVLRALLAYDRDHPMAPALLRGLLASRKNGVWPSTQAAAWALTTLAEYQSARNWATGNSEARMWLDQRTVASTRLTPRNNEAEFSMKWLSPDKAADLIFEHQGKGTLFYSARLTFEQVDPNQEASAQGFEITHSLAPLSYLDAPAPSLPLNVENTVTAGQTLRGEVVLFSPVPRHYVQVQVNLPAGFEPIDPNLTKEFNLADRTQDWWDRPMSVRRSDRFHQVVRDDRIDFYLEELAPGTVRLPYVAQANTVGTFTLPPARVEEMYRPEHYANTATCKMVVAPRAAPTP